MELVSITKALSVPVPAEGGSDGIKRSENTMKEGAAKKCKTNPILHYPAKNTELRNEPKTCRVEVERRRMNKRTQFQNQSFYDNL
jgi:hypothetical protein